MLMLKFPETCNDENTVHVLLLFTVFSLMPSILLVLELLLLSLYLDLFPLSYICIIKKIEPPVS